jgi:tRNA A37 threonylcarbamoyladenosine modification protein TsaB
VLIDARSDRVYGACYGVDSDGVHTLVPPHAGRLGEVLGGVPPGAVFVGDAAERHRAVIEAAGHPVVPPETVAPLAHGLLWYLRARPDHPVVADVGAWEPAYLRPSRAEPSWSS